MVSSSSSTTTSSILTYDFCDADALPAELTPLSSLEYNQFYKLCPGLQQHPNGTILPLGQPRCGDDSNYSFFLTRPAAAATAESVNEKIVIELSGGGACWDSITCALQSSQLAFPTLLNSFVGSSCASISSLDILCSKTIADIDLSEYSYLFIPYCTQDIHLGDAISTDYGVQHVGGHNLYRTLSWVFENYPNPQHVIVTGCSAGATPLPVVYDLINRHYQKVAASSTSSSSNATTTTTTTTTTNKKSESGGDGGGSGIDDGVVIIDVIADSSVFLTPEPFLDKYISNWNLGTIMDMIDFDFDTYKNQTNFSVAILDHVLDRSKSTDDVAYTFHDADQISQYYYKMMNGSSLSELFDDGDGGGRKLLSMSSSSSLTEGRYLPIMHHQKSTPATTTLHRGLNEDVFQSQWLAELNNTISLAGVGHSNFHVYFMNGTGHCNYGLVREKVLHAHLSDILL